MKEKKGFTLIELLAVIAILAILLIIAIPSVIKMYNKAKTNTFVNEVQSVITTAEKQYMSDQMSGSAPSCYYKGDEEVEGCGTLEMSGNDKLHYYIEFENGKISTAIVEDGTKGVNVTGSKLNAASVNANKVETTDFTEVTTSLVPTKPADTCFTTSDVEGGVQITAYDASCGTNIVIPSKINGKIVKTLTSGSFAAKGLTQVKIPGSVETIASSAFPGNMYLTKVTFENGIKTIASGSFSGCQAITELNIPGSVETIESFCSGCSGLKKVVLNQGTKKIASAAFGSGTNNLEEVTIPSSVTTIENNAFASTALKSVDLSNVTNLGDGVFQYCSNLTKATLNTSLTAIPDYLFAYGSNSIDVNLSSMTNLKTIGEYAFAYKNFKNIVVPDGVETIKYRAFLGNGGNFETGTITIPESVMTIGEYAFFNARVTKVCIKGKSSSADFTSYPTSDPFTDMNYGTFSDITWNCTD